MSSTRHLIGELVVVVDKVRDYIRHRECRHTGWTIGREIHEILGGLGMEVEEYCTYGLEYCSEYTHVSISSPSFLLSSFPLTDKYAVLLFSSLLTDVTMQSSMVSSIYIFDLTCKLSRCRKQDQY